MRIRKKIDNPAGSLVRAFPPSIPSPDEIKTAMTPAGGWTKAQLAEWGIPWTKDGPPKGWKRKLEKAWREQNKIKKA